MNPFALYQPRYDNDMDDPRKHGYPTDTSSLVYYYNPYGYVDYPSQDNARKRQRRQAAGALVMQTLFKGPAAGAAAMPGAPDPLAAKKRSTAQPRPQLQIPPRGIGPIFDPNVNDVLSGRGGRINAHPGNVQFREIVQVRKKDYLSKATKKLDKAHIAADIVRGIRTMDPPGRFLKEDADGAWYDIGDAKAIKKVGQALREDAPDIRQELTGKDNSSGDEDEVAVAAPVASSSKESSSGTPEPAKASPSPKTTPAAAACREEVKAVVVPAAADHHRTEPALVKSSVTVSGRGAKVAVNQSQPSGRLPTGTQPAYQPVAYQEMPSLPTYQQVVPPTQPSQQQQPQPPKRANFLANLGLRHAMPKAAVSGAAAAAMSQQQDDDDPQQHLFEAPLPRDVAFGRTFHPAMGSSDIQGGESSLMSGMSGGPSIAMSGLTMSNISGLSDPMSSLSAGDTNLRRHYANPHHPNAHLQHPSAFQATRSSQLQLQQLRNQWAAHQQQQQQQQQQIQQQLVPMAVQQVPSFSSSLNTADMTATRSLLGSASAGLGDSLRNSFPMQQQEPYSVHAAGIIAGFDDMSIANNSLVGGGIREDSLLAGASLVSGVNSLANFSATMNSYAAPIPEGSQLSGNRDGSQSSGSGSRDSGGRGHVPGSHYHLGEVSVASMSIQSGDHSLTSMPGSIMSDLSETLVALDLAEHKRLNQM